MSGKKGLDRRGFLQLATMTAGGIALGGAGAGLGPLEAYAAVKTQRLPLGPSTFGIISGDMLNFDPETDGWAPYFRSRVPRAKRIAPLAATQAHPDLDPRTELFLLDGDYRGSAYDMRPAPYADEGDVYTYRYWSYLDFWSSWHGQVLEQFTDEQLADNSIPKDYGVVEIPAVGWVDAAHRHGARALTCWFWPRPTSEYFSRLIQQRPDGSFPVADKLIEMRRYFGFDGMFINQENPASAGLDGPAIDDAAAARTFRQMIDYLKAKDPEFYLMWYDCYNADTGKIQYRNRIDEVNAVWLATKDRLGADSMWPNYDWPRRDPDLTISRDTVLGLGLDPYTTAYASVEAQKGFFNPLERMDNFAKPGAVSPTSFALFVPSEFWNTRARSGAIDTVEGRAAARRLEQLYWSGPSGDPSTSGRRAAVLPPGRTDIDNPDNWSGVAHSITERSGFGALPLATSFDIGVGDGYWLGGKRVRDDGWNGVSAASLQPTWQYWTVVENADWSVALDATRAWEGGASLRLRGSAKPGGSIEVKLFKTDISVPGGRPVEAAVRTRGAGAHEVHLGVILADDPGETIWVPLRAGSVAEGWQDWRARLRPATFRGRRIASLSVRVVAMAAGAQDVSLGLFSLAVADRRVPERPTGVRASEPTRERGRAQAYLAWDYRADVYAWDVLQVLGGSGQRWLGRVHNDVFFADGVRAGAGQRVTFEVVAIGHDLRRSEPARVRLAY